MIRSSWLAARALLAIALMIGFYVLAIGIALGLFFIPYAEWVYAERLDLRIAIFCVIAGVLVLSSIIPRQQEFVAPGPQLTAKEQPRMFERLKKLADSVGQRMPKEVYLVSDLNAWVSEVGHGTRLGRRRIMGIGLPLLQVITVSQFEAILAHEFGHYHGGDTRLGPWIYRTRVAIGQTVQRLSAAASESRIMSAVRGPFLLYGKMFLRVTHAISRAQEFSADRLAAETVGADALAGGLSEVHRASAAANYYLNNEALPVVRSGFAPPLAAGLSSFMQLESIARSMDECLQAELAANKSDPYDTHPPLARRIAVLRDLPNAISLDNTPAVSLIENLPQVETRLMNSWLPPGSEPLQGIQWQDTGASVWLPIWRNTASQGVEALRGVTLEHLYGIASNLDAFASRLNLKSSGIIGNALRSHASGVLACSLACSLHEAGWAIEASPGVMWFTRGETRVNPFSIVSELSSGEMNEEGWKETIQAARLKLSMPMGLPGTFEAPILSPPPGVFPACPSCGVLYNPADYRAEAKRIFCTACGAELVRP